MLDIYCSESDGSRILLRLFFSMNNSSSLTPRVTARRERRGVEHEKGLWSIGASDCCPLARKDAGRSGMLRMTNDIHNRCSTL